MNLIHEYKFFLDTIYPSSSNSASTTKEVWILSFLPLILYFFKLKLLDLLKTDANNNKIKKRGTKGRKGSSKNQNQNQNNVKKSRASSCCKNCCIVVFCLILLLVALFVVLLKENNENGYRSSYLNNFEHPS